MHLGKIDDALIAAESAVSLSPTSGDAAAALIAACMRSGDVGRAACLADDLKRDRPHLTVDAYRRRALPGRETFQTRQERFYAAPREAGLPES